MFFAELTRLNLESSGQDECPKRTQPLEKLEEPQDPKVKIEELSNSARDVGLKQLGKVCCVQQKLLW